MTMVLTILLYLSLGWLLGTTVILLMNRSDFTPLLSADRHAFSEAPPLVSLCIPARNEENTIEKCIKSALRQTYPGVEILILDDGSTDRTPELLNRMAIDHPGRFTLLEGKPKPEGWLGKPWACQQLAEAASGDILLFLDADTRLEKDAVAQTVRTMGHDVIQLLTVWPMQQLESFWEKAVIPLVYYALLTLLPARYVYRKPAWLPAFLWKRFRTKFAAACGQFMAFKSETYFEIGGHQSVKDRVVEDVELAKQIKKHGHSMRMYHGGGTVSCRMYESAGDLFEGFRKNFLAGFGYNITYFVAAGLLHLAVYVLPFMMLLLALLLTMPPLWIGLSAASVTLILLHRIILARWYGWSLLYVVTHPAGVLWFQWLGITVLRDRLSGRSAQWKGRPVS